MSRLAELKRRLRERSEHYLLLERRARLGAGVPATVAPFSGREGLLWRWLFVPLYRRVPWALKRRAMDVAADDRARLDAARAPAARAVAPAAAVVRSRM